MVTHMPRDPIKRKECNRRYRAKLYKERDRVWGYKCFLCSSKIRLCLHNKKFEPHEANASNISKALKEPEKWVRLCGKCHDGTHFCKEILGLEWGDIIELLSQEPR